MKTIDRYLVRQVIATTLTMTAIGLAALLLERLLRLFDLFASPDDVLRNLAKMLVLLAPHYLGIALPAAFFFGVLLTFGRLDRENELAAFTASGNGLHRLMRPTMSLAFVMALIAVLILGFFQPYARYAYRSIKHTVANASLTAAVREGAFIHANGLTFFAESSTAGTDMLQLSKIFVLQDEGKGVSQATTASRGMLQKSFDGSGAVLRLRDGLRADFQEDGEVNTISFKELSWPVDAGAAARYRPRGRDRRELTLPELWQAQFDPPEEPSLSEIRAELNLRLTLIASTLILPLLAVALAVKRGRRVRDFSVVKGLLILVVYHEALDFGASLVKRDMVSFWIGLWLPFTVLLCASLLLFYRTSFAVPRGPGFSFTALILNLFERTARAFGAGTK